MHRTLNLVLLAILTLSVPTLGQDGSLASWAHASQQDRREALILARSAYDAYAQNRTTLPIPGGLSPLFSQRCGVFVSTMVSGAPRSCMGTLYPMQSDLAHEIVANAVASAGQDRRFKPVSPDELKSLRLIVSFVAAPEPISAAEVAKLDPVSDGLAARYGDRYGVVLSGETYQHSRMVDWARTRAGAGPGDPVTYYRIYDIRLIEAAPSDPGSQTGPE